VNVVCGRGGDLAVHEGPEKDSRNRIIGSRMREVQWQRRMLCLGGAGNALFLYDNYSSSYDTLSESGDS